MAAVVAATAGSSGWAGSYLVPPGDIEPVISHDSSAIIFFRTSGPFDPAVPLPPGLYVTGPTRDSTRPLPLPENMSFALSRTWRWIAFVSFDAGKPAVVVMHPDGTDRRTIASGADVNDFVGAVSWDPSEQRLAFVRRDGLWIASVDGAPQTFVAVGGVPAWSPDGARIAFLGSGRVLVADPDGSNTVTIPQPAAPRTPVWSPAGNHIAFAVLRSNRAGMDIVVATRDGRVLTRYPARQGLGQIAWSPDGKSFAYTAEGYFSKGTVIDNGVWRVRLGLTRRAQQTRLGPTGRGLLAPGLAWAPNGCWLVTAFEGECKDRVGLYRLAADSRAPPRRLTNWCRIDGTRGADTILGTLLFDTIYGLGGNDHISANDGNYQGDDLYGGTGNDVLFGGEWNNVLVGGPGDDRLNGWTRDDTLIGGPGRDLLLGGPGKDTIYARDGAADRVNCGTNTRANPERPDVAYVDRFDSVAHCEVVRRR